MPWRSPPTRWATEPAEVRRAMVMGAPEPQGYAELVAEREARVPLQHLTGVAHFRRLTLAVGPGVFVPRPETEVTAGLAIDAASAIGPGALVVDLCTGSGAIALAVKDELPAARVLAVELSDLAHGWAVANRDRLGLDVDVRLGDATTAFEDLEGEVDVVVSNPPYIPVGAVPVDPEVRDHDPAVALYGGSVDGLAIPLAVAAPGRGAAEPGRGARDGARRQPGRLAPAGAAGHGGVGAGGRPRRPVGPATDHRCGAWWRRGPGRSLTGPATEDSDSVQDEDQQRDDEQHSDDRPDQVGTTHGGQASRVVSVRAVTRARRRLGAATSGEPSACTPIRNPRLAPMSPVFDCTTEHGRADAIPKAAAGVRDGRLVVLPTDTLYGIGADAFSPDAVRALLDAKGRGSDMPPPVLVADARTVDGLATEVPDHARALVAAFWPGPLTIVLRAQPSLMWDLGDTGGTVALRMPDDPVALALLREVGPMAVSSANRTGHPASRTVVEAASQLGAAVEFYLDGGPVAGGLASTIVDCTRDEPVFLRVGAISEADVMEVVERARADALELGGAQPDETDQPDASREPDEPDQPGAPEAPTASEQRESTDDD